MGHNAFASAHPGSVGKSEMRGGKKRRKGKEGGTNGKMRNEKREKEKRNEKGSRK